jgi:hypothetical protein
MTATPPASEQLDPNLRCTFFLTFYVADMMLVFLDHWQSTWPAATKRVHNRSGCRCAPEDLLAERTLAARMRMRECNSATECRRRSPLYGFQSKVWGAGSRAPQRRNGEAGVKVDIRQSHASRVSLSANSRYKSGSTARVQTPSRPEARPEGCAGSWSKDEAITCARSMHTCTCTNCDGLSTRHIRQQVLRGNCAATARQRPTTTRLAERGATVDASRHPIDTSTETKQTQVKDKAHKKRRTSLATPRCCDACEGWQAKLLRTLCLRLSKLRTWDLIPFACLRTRTSMRESNLSTCLGG